MSLSGPSAGLAATLMVATVALVMAAATPSAAERARRHIVDALGPVGGPGRLVGVQAAATGTADVGPRALETWPPAALQAAGMSFARADAASSLHVTARDSSRLAATIYLYRGDAAAAAAALEEGLRQSPADPYLLNDAAATYLALAGQSIESSGPNLARAIDRAQQAIDLRRGWAEPRYNLAAALRALGMVPQAAAALAQAVRLEPGVGWRRRMVAELEDLRESPALAPATTVDAALDPATPLDPHLAHQLMTRHPGVAEEAALRRLLSAWGRSLRHGPQAAGTALRSAAVLTQVERRGQQDPFLRDVVAAIEHAPPDRRAALASAHVAYSTARDRYDIGELEAAGAEFSRAADLCAGTPFHFEVELRRATVLYQLRRLDETWEAIGRVRGAASRRGYAGIEARALWLSGLVRMQQARVEESTAAYTSALDLYGRLGDVDNAASLANTAADTLRLAGDTQRGWQLLVRSARQLPSIESPQRRYLILFNLSLYAQDEGLFRAARSFQTAAIEAARARGAILTVVESQLRRAQLELRDGGSAAGLADLRAGERTLRDVRSDAGSAYLESWRGRIAAHLTAERDPASASRALEEVAAAFDRTEPAEVPALLLEASRAALRAGDPDRGRMLLQRGLAVVRRRHARLARPEFRLMHFSATWDLYHDLIALEFPRDPREALGIAEAGRAALVPNGPRPGALSDALARLPRDSAILYYACLRDRVLVWTIAAGTITSVAIPYAFDALTSDVDVFRRSVQAGTASTPSRTLGAELYRRLVAPAVAPLRGVSRLLVAPDGPLGDLPLGALVDPRSNRLAIELYDLAFIPSMAALSREAGQRVPGSMLAVGYNGAAADVGPQLAAAEEEATAVARFYAQSVALVGDRATPERVRAVAAHSAVIHIAAHARANRVAPWESLLRLSPAAAGQMPGTVRFEDLRGWALSHGPLVILSACETATGARFRGEGVVSLAKPFLAAGARTVVGTLWDLDDRAALTFMGGFHRDVAAGVPPIRALRAAQLAALGSGDPTLRAPSLWSAYVANTRELVPSDSTAPRPP